MEEGGADDVAVGDEGDGLVAVRRGEALDEADDAALGFEHGLAARDAGAAAVGVPELPERVGVELGEGFAGPVAEVELVEVLGDGELRAGAVRDGAGGFDRACEGARIDVRDRPRGKGVGEAVRFLAASLRQVDAGRAAGEGSADGVGGRVADEEEGGQGLAVSGG